MGGRSFLFVYPETPDTYWSFRHALSFVGKKALMPPLGLATAAAMLPDYYDCKIVDLNVEPLEEDDILSADLVLLSAMLVQRESFRDIVRRCNRLGVPVAAGGPYPTSCRHEIEGVDHFILNEGEVTFPRFLRDWERGDPKPLYASEEKPGLAGTPVPRYDLFDAAKYNVMPVQFSRGCPFGCEFCDITGLFGRVPRVKPAENFLRELDALEATGFRGNVFIVDDNFIGNAPAVKDLLREIADRRKTRGLPFRFCTEASVNLASDPELLDLMRDAGFYMVFVGLETPVEESLRSAGKLHNLRGGAAEAVREIQARGIEVSGGFIVGFDTDPPDVFDRQITFIRDLAVPTAMIGLLTALPATPLYERLKSEGRLLAESSGNNTHELELNFAPRLPADFLRDGYRRTLSALYSPREYFRRCRDFLDRIPRTREAAGNGEKVFSPGNFLAAVRSVFRQTFSSLGPAYLAFLSRALLRRPDQTVRIFTLAIQGHHFFVITRRIAGGTPRGEKPAALRKALRRATMPAYTEKGAP